GGPDPDAGPEGGTGGVVGGGVAAQGGEAEGGGEPGPAAAGGAVALVHGLLVSGGDLAASALGRGQGRGQRPRDQPPLRGNEPAGGRGAAGADLRRVRRSG